LATVPVPPAYPTQSAPAPLNPPARLVAALDTAVGARAVMLAAPDTALRIMQRRLKDANVVMVFNESDHTVKNTLRHSLGKLVERWDAETGKIEPVTGETGRIALDLKPYETAFYVIKD